jgi:hypothetical protein
MVEILGPKTLARESAVIPIWGLAAEVTMGEVVSAAQAAAVKNMTERNTLNFPIAG